MNYKKFIKKLKVAQIFQQLEEPSGDIQTEESQVGQPLPTPINTVTPVTNTPTLPSMEDNSVIKTDLKEWSPSRGYNKSTKYYYLQLYIPPAITSQKNSNNMDIGEYLISNGYKFNKKFGMFSKQIKPEDAIVIGQEFDSIESSFNVSIERSAIKKMQEIFGFDENTSVEEVESAEDISKIKFMRGDDKEKYKIAKDIIRKRLEDIANNLESPETKSFIEQFLNLNNKFYRYSPTNSFLIAWQNITKNPETGEIVPRSGTVSSSGAWEEKFGRKVKEGEVGMDIFVPIGGGTKEVKPAAMNSLITPMVKFKAINKSGDLSNDTNIRKFFGFMKKQIAFSRKSWSKGKIYKSNYDYLVRLYNDHKDEFKSVDSIIQYLSNKASSGEKETTFSPLRFTMKPVYDMDQTEVIDPSKDPKAEMERVEAMWLGENKEPDEKCSSLAALAIKAAGAGEIVKNKNITINLDAETGSAGGYSSNGNISVRAGSMGTQQLFTIFHELAHEILHWGENRSELSKKMKEVDAEATAAIVMEHYGFNTEETKHAINYISFFTKDKDFVMSRFQPILEASNAIVSGIETQKVANFGGKTAGTNWYSRKKFAGALKNTLLDEILSFKESDMLKEGADFGNPFSGLAQDKKMTKEELIRAIRFSIASEYEAIQIYMEIAESTDNKLSQETLKSIADEERVHAGELLELLKELDPKEQDFYDEGAKEVKAENKLNLLKESHYSEGEEFGEGYGGPKQFGERRLGDWIEEHREEIAIMRNIIKNNYKGFDEYRTKLLTKYKPPYNQKIVDGIISAAMRGQRI